MYFVEMEKHLFLAMPQGNLLELLLFKLYLAHSCRAKEVDRFTHPGLNLGHCLDTYHA